MHFGVEMLFDYCRSTGCRLGLLKHERAELRRSMVMHSRGVFLARWVLKSQPADGSRELSVAADAYRVSYFSQRLRLQDCTFHRIKRVVIVSKRLFGGITFPLSNVAGNLDWYDGCPQDATCMAAGGGDHGASDWSGENSSLLAAAL